MTRYLVLIFSSFLLAGPVSAQQSAAEKAEFEKTSASVARGQKLEREAESRAMEDCSITRFVFPFPFYNASTRKEEIFNDVISIQWNGGCVAGKRDGPGVLSWTFERESTGDKQEQVWTAEGRFVNGQRVGMWCMTFQYQLKRDGQLVYRASDSGCSILASHTNALTGNYRKQPDGSWKGYSNGVPNDSFLAAGALEAQSAKVMAEVVAGKTDLKAELVVRSQSLDDLVRGSKIVLAPSAAPITLKDQRVAILLSSQAVIELERFRRERQALISASSGLGGNANQSRTAFIAASNPDRLLLNIVKTLSKHAKTVQPVDDLAGLQKGGFDYALILDWKHMSQFEQLIKYYSSAEASRGAVDMDMSTLLAEAIVQLSDKPTMGSKAGMPRIAVGQSMGAFLINRELKAVKQFSQIPLNAVLTGSSIGELGYMGELAQFFEYRWGKGSNLGQSIDELDAFLRNN